VIYLVLEEQLKKWVMPIRNWNLARSRFDVEFGNLLVADANE
jgi:transposase-like protein